MEFDIHAYEVRAMIDNHTIVNSMISTIFGLVRHYSELSLKNETAKTDIWWPFLKNCFIDIACYGFCAFTKKTRKGVVYPEFVPVANCTIGYDNEGSLEVTPRHGKLTRVPNIAKKIQTYVLFEPRWDTLKLRGAMPQLLMSYRRLLRLNSDYIQQENRIANPLVYLEDAHNSGNRSAYESITAQNPSWASTIPGMILSAREQSKERQEVNEYIGRLQSDMVDMINRTHDGQNESSAGVRLEKRKRVNDIQVPLPSNKRANMFLPSNRCNPLEYEEFFLKEVPWSCGLSSLFLFLFLFFAAKTSVPAFVLVGFPMSFFENQQSKVSTNYKLLESISAAALQTQVSNLDGLLQQVSRHLFGLQEILLNSPMRVKINLKEEDVDFEVGPGNKAPAPPAVGGAKK